MEQNKLNLNFFKLTWPIFIEIAMWVMLDNVGTLMLGHYSDNAVAASGNVMQLIMLVFTLYEITANGATILISQNLGGKNIEKSKKIASVSIPFNLMVGLILSLLMFIFSPKLVALLGLKGEVYNYGMIYFIIHGSFSFFTAFAVSCNAVLRSYGFTKTPMITTLTANIFNVIGIFCVLYSPFGLPVLGVPGVAAVSVIVTAITSFISYFIMKKKTGVKIASLKELYENRDILLEIFKIGGPSAGEGVAYQSAQIAIASIIATFGAAALAAKAYASTLSGMIMLIGLAAYNGLQILSGYLSGAKRYNFIKIYAYRIFFSVFPITMISAFLLYLFRYKIFGSLTDNQEIINIGVKLLAASLLLEAGRSLNFVFIGALKGAGDVKFAVITGIISMWGNGVLWTYIFAVHFKMGVLGAWFGMAMDEWFRGIIMFLRWRSMVWKKHTIDKKRELVRLEHKKESCA